MKEKNEDENEEWEEKKVQITDNDDFETAVFNMWNNTPSSDNPDYSPGNAILYIGYII